MSAILALASTAIFRSAWAESAGAVLRGRGSESWEGVLRFLRAYPNAWLDEAAYTYPGEKSTAQEQDGAADNDEEEEEEEDNDVDSALDKADERRYRCFPSLPSTSDPLPGTTTSRPRPATP